MKRKKNIREKIRTVAPRDCRKKNENFLNIVGVVVLKDVAPRDCGFIMGDMETIPIPVPRMVFKHNVHKHCPKNLL